MHQRSYFKLLFSVLITIMLASCSGHSIDSAKTKIDTDFIQLKSYWNSKNLDAFVKFINREHFLPNPEKHAEDLQKLRMKLGKIRQDSGLVITDKTTDKRAKFVANMAMTLQRGVLTITLAYNSNLDIVGYHFQYQSLS